MYGYVCSASGNSAYRKHGPLFCPPLRRSACPAFLCILEKPHPLSEQLQLHVCRVCAPKIMGQGGCLLPALFRDAVKGGVQIQDLLPCIKRHIRSSVPHAEPVQQPAISEAVIFRDKDDPRLGKRFPIRTCLERCCVHNSLMIPGADVQGQRPSAASLPYPHCAYPCRRPQCCTDYRCRTLLSVAQIWPQTAHRRTHVWRMY